MKKTPRLTKTSLARLAAAPRCQVIKTRPSPSKSALARAAATSRTQVLRDIARGADVSSVGSYLAWRAGYVVPRMQREPADVMSESLAFAELDGFAIERALEVLKPALRKVGLRDPAIITVINKMVAVYERTMYSRGEADATAYAAILRSTLERQS